MKRKTVRLVYALEERFETIQYPARVISDWIRFYNHRCPHQALGMKTPAETFAFAA